jgi:pyruvate dehydrogenase E1 component beta subunit
VVLESELLYNESYPLSPEAQDPDFVLPIGRANIEVAGTHLSLSRSDWLLGSDITIISFSRQVGNCVKAAAKLKEEGINAEVSMPIDICVTFVVGHQSAQH